MTVLNQTQAAMKYSMILVLFIEVYLLITNLTYFCRKLRYHLPPLLKYDSIARRWRCVAEFSRTGFLFLVTVYTLHKVCWAGVSAANTSQYPCRVYFRVPTIYFYLCMNCRVVFAFARLALFKSCLHQTFIYESVGVTASLLIMVALTIWNQVALEYFVVDNVCFTSMSFALIIACSCVFVIYEVTSFILYYKPLRENDGLSGTDFDNCSILLTTNDQEFNEQAEDMKESSIPRVQSTNPSTRSLEHTIQVPARTYKISTNSLDLIKMFHKTVQRNFWAGVTTISIAFIQLTFYILFDGSNVVADTVGLSSDTTTWYWQSGFGEFFDSALAVGMYMSMIVCESDWRQALIPFWCWKGEFGEF